MGPATVTIRLSALLLICLFLGVGRLYSQDPEARLQDRVDSLLKITLGPTYESADIVEVDSALAGSTRYSDWQVPLFEDPKGRLRHCLLVTYCSWDSLPVPDQRNGVRTFLNPLAGVAIIRDDKIVWRSQRIISEFSQIGSRISGFGDLNNDGIIDVIVSRYAGTHGELEFLWLISLDTRGGTLLNGVDADGYPTIKGGYDTFQVHGGKRGGPKVLQAADMNTGGDRTVTYRWNGKVFVRQ